MNRRTQRGSIYLGVAGGLFLVSGALAGGYFVLSGDARADRGPVPVVAPAGAKSDVPDLTSLVETSLNDEVSVVIAGTTVPMRWTDLGVQLDPDELEHAARKAASDEPLVSLRDVGALPVTVDRAAAVTALTELKGRFDRAAQDARLDLELREVKPDVPGFGIDVYASLARIEAAARSGAAELELAGVALPARVSIDTLGIQDISQVMGHYETKFAVADKDRNFNLKLAASKLNGHVIAAGETFSFNTVVGERTEKEGYKIAHVIQAGEMVDGLAGGTCQISTTLFGAAFFAALDIEDMHNHSRPSAYTPLAFDATVVWPNADLVLKNPYDFPVAIHYVVASGVAKVEILGKGRPYTKVEFEREILEQSPYETVEREDPELPLDQTLIDQEGFEGYVAIRYRKIYQGRKLVRKDKWRVTYKPVVEYIRRGTNPDPLAVLPEQPKHKGPMKPTDKNSHMSQ